MATIYKDKRTGIWYINYIDPDSHDRVRQPVSDDHDLARDKNYAKKILADINFKISQGKLKKLSGITLSHFLAEYLVKYAEPRKTERGLERDHYIIKHIIDFWGEEKPAEEISVADLDNYVAKRRKQVTNRTINRELGMMKRAWKWGLNCDLLSENRIGGYENLPPAKPNTTYLSMDDINTLLSNTGIDFRIFLLFVLYTGVRIEKALMLRWREIDFELGVIMIIANVKTNKPVVVPLANDLANILTQYKERTKPESDDRLFPWTYNAIRQRFDRLRKRTGLTGYTLNSLRHTFATYSSFLGGDHQATSKAMGHSSERTTGIYTHYPIQRLRDAVSKLDYMKKLHADIFADIEK